MLQPGDSVTVADNRPGARDGDGRGNVRVLGAGERQTSYHARNRAAALGTADWLVFLDADVLPPADLLARYFEPVPDARVGVLAGAVVDEEPAADESTSASRYAWLKSSMSQEITLAHDQWAFAQTANAAVRRKAFEQVGGFEAGVRSGGDADLCFRVRAAGWDLERREQRGGRASQSADRSADAGAAGSPWGGGGLAFGAVAGGASAAPLAGARLVELEARGGGRRGGGATAIGTRRCSGCSTGRPCGRLSLGG